MAAAPRMTAHKHEARPTIADRARRFAEICKAEGVDEKAATDMIRQVLTRGGVADEVAGNHAARAVSTIYAGKTFGSRSIVVGESRKA